VAKGRGAASMPKDSIRTRVVTVDTAKHFIIPIETLIARPKLGFFRGCHVELEYRIGAKIEAP